MIASITDTRPASAVPPHGGNGGIRPRPNSPTPPVIECIRRAMAERAALLAQIWPPAPGAYDYVLTLNDEEIAWEGLRRNPDYQQHYRLYAAGHAKSRRLPSGQSIWRIASHPSGCERWGLHPFCRSGADRAGGSYPLAHRSGNRHAACSLQASSNRNTGTPGARRPPVHSPRGLRP
jgi:Family of unknown function (DUF6499)